MNMNTGTDLLLVAVLLIIAITGLPAAFLPLLKEDVAEALFGGSGVVPDDDPVDHST